MFYKVSPTLQGFSASSYIFLVIRHSFILQPQRKSVGLSVSLSTGRSWNTRDNERVKSAHTYRFVRHGRLPDRGNFREWRYRRNGSQTSFLITFGKLSRFSSRNAVVDVLAQRCLCRRKDTSFFRKQLHCGLIFLISRAK